MPGFDEHNLTESVVQRFDGCESPRLKQVIQSLTLHLHAFVMETGIRQEEWMAAIVVLTRTGTFIGALILTLVINGMNLLSIHTNWQPSVTGVIVLATVLIDRRSSRKRG